jgi:hypothetical protein
MDISVNRAVLQCLASAYTSASSESQTLITRPDQDI